MKSPNLESPISWLQESTKGLVFTDAAFEDGKINLEVWTEYFNSEAQIYVGIRNVTESYYQYMKTYYIHEWNQYPDLFSGEPVPMTNNISGGYGLLGAYATAYQTVDKK